MGSVLDEMDGKAEQGLLDQLDQEGENLGRAWRPDSARDDGSTDPAGIEGVTVKRFTMPSDPSFGPVKDVPGVVIRDQHGADWQIRGYRSILASEIEEKDPQPGDTFAVKYMGIPAGKKYHVYRAGVRKGVPGTVPPPADGGAATTQQSDKPPF